jgi:uncharacterized protein YndB with AHSA1/START domain
LVTIEHSLVVERPAADVFAYLTEPANLPEWQASVLEAKSDGPIQPGAKLTELRKFLGIRIESTLEVTDHEPSEQFTLRVVAGPVSIEVRHHLTPTNRGTRLDVVLEGETGDFLELGQPIVERAIRRELVADFATLKDLLEARSPK